MTQTLTQIDTSLDFMTGETDGRYQANQTPCFFGNLRAVERAAKSRWHAAASKHAAIRQDEYIGGFIFGYEDTMLTATLRARAKNRRV
jgi:hypothetical protein